MELKINREYAIRHFGVAALFFGLCLYFLYDGAIGYPAMDDATFKEKILHNLDYANFAEKRKATTDRQFQFAGLLFIAAAVVGIGAWRVKCQTLTWDEEQMTGSLTGGTPLRFADIARVDDADWKKKGILRVHAADGRRLTLDAWHHMGAAELAEKILARGNPPAADAAHQV